jgi:hypothetical protein
MGMDHRRIDIRLRHFRGMADMVKKDISPHPLPIGLLGPAAVVAEAQCPTELIQQLGFIGPHGDTLWVGVSRICFHSCFLVRKNLHRKKFLKYYTLGPLDIYFFFSFFAFRLSFSVSCAFFCCSLLPLSFFP